MKNQQHNKSTKNTLVLVGVQIGCQKPSRPLKTQLIGSWLSVHNLNHFTMRQGEGGSFQSPIRLFTYLFIPFFLGLNTACLNVACVYEPKGGFLTCIGYHLPLPSFLLPLNQLCSNLLLKLSIVRKLIHYNIAPLNGLTQWCSFSYEEKKVKGDTGAILIETKFDVLIP